MPKKTIIVKKFKSTVTYNGFTYNEGVLVSNLDTTKGDEAVLLKSWVEEVEVAEDTDNVLDFNKTNGNNVSKERKEAEAKAKSKNNK